MKFADIKTGDELYYDSRTDWADRQYGTKVVVLDGDALYEKPPRWNRNAGPQKSVLGKGGQVLVRGVRYQTEREFIVPLAHLRGPYEATNKQCAANAKASQRARQDAQDAANQRAQREADAVQTLKDWGIEAYRDYAHYGAGRVTISVEDVEKIVTAFADAANLL